MSTASRGFLVVPISLILFAFVGAAFAQGNFDEADDMCPSVTATRVYRADKSPLAEFEEAGKKYFNLYGTICKDIEGKQVAANGICVEAHVCQAKFCGGKPCALPKLKVEDVQKALEGGLPPAPVQTSRTNQSLMEMLNEQMFNPTPLAEQKTELSPSANSVGELFKQMDANPGLSGTVQEQKQIGDLFSPTPLNPTQESFQLQARDEDGNVIPRDVGPQNTMTNPNSTFGETQPQTPQTENSPCDSWWSCMQERVSGAYGEALEEAAQKTTRNPFSALVPDGKGGYYLPSNVRLSEAQGPPGRSDADRVTGLDGPAQFKATFYTAAGTGSGEKFNGSGFASSLYPIGTAGTMEFLDKNGDVVASRQMYVNDWGNLGPGVGADLPRTTVADVQAETGQRFLRDGVFDVRFTPETVIQGKVSGDGWYADTSAAKAANAYTQARNDGYSVADALAAVQQNTGAFAAYQPTGNVSTPETNIASSENIPLPRDNPFRVAENPVSSTNVASVSNPDLPTPLAAADHFLQSPNVRSLALTGEPTRSAEVPVIAPSGAAPPEFAAVDAPVSNSAVGTTVRIGDNTARINADGSVEVTVVTANNTAYAKTIPADVAQDLTFTQMIQSVESQVMSLPKDPTRVEPGQQLVFAPDTPSDVIVTSEVAPPPPAGVVVETPKVATVVEPDAPQIPESQIRERIAQSIPLDQYDKMTPLSQQLARDNAVQGIEFDQRTAQLAEERRLASPEPPAPAAPAPSALTTLSNAANAVADAGKSIWNWGSEKVASLFGTTPEPEAPTFAEVPADEPQPSATREVPTVTFEAPQTVEAPSPEIQAAERAQLEARLAQADQETAAYQQRLEQGIKDLDAQAQSIAIPPAEIQASLEAEAEKIRQAARAEEGDTVEDTPNVSEEKPATAVPTKSDATIPSENLNLLAREQFKKIELLKKDLNLLKDSYEQNRAAGWNMSGAGSNIKRKTAELEQERGTYAAMQDSLNNGAALPKDLSQIIDRMGKGQGPYSAGIENFAKETFGAPADARWEEMKKSYAEGDILGAAKSWTQYAGNGIGGWLVDTGKTVAEVGAAKIQETADAIGVPIDNPFRASPERQAFCATNSGTCNAEGIMGAVDLYGIGVLGKVVLAPARFIGSKADDLVRSASEGMAAPARLMDDVVGSSLPKAANLEPAGGRAAPTSGTIDDAFARVDGAVNDVKSVGSAEPSAPPAPAASSPSNNPFLQGTDRITSRAAGEAEVSNPAAQGIKNATAEIDRIAAESRAAAEAPIPQPKPAGEVPAPSGIPNIGDYVPTYADKIRLAWNGTWDKASGIVSDARNSLPEWLGGTKSVAEKPRLELVVDNPVAPARPVEPPTRIAEEIPERIAVGENSSPVPLEETVAGRRAALRDVNADRPAPPEPTAKPVEPEPVATPEPTISTPDNLAALRKAAAEDLALKERLAADAARRAENASPNWAQNPNGLPEPGPAGSLTNKWAEVDAAIARQRAAEVVPESTLTSVEPSLVTAEKPWYQRAWESVTGKSETPPAVETPNAAVVRQEYLGNKSVVASEEYNQFVRIPLKGTDAEIQEAAIAKYLGNKDALREEYIARFGNRVINGDNAKTLFTDVGYNGANADAVHEASSALAKDVWRHSLATNSGSDAVFYFGGAGAGKTSTVGKLLPEIESNAAVVYDATLSSVSGAQARINEALAAGKNVELVYVYRNPLDAFENGVITRMQGSGIDAGRVVEVTRFVETHKGSYAVAEHFLTDARVNVQLIDNSRGAGNAVIMSREEFAAIKYPSDLAPTIQKSTDELFASGRISEEQYQALTFRSKSAEAVDIAPLEVDSVRASAEIAPVAEKPSLWERWFGKSEPAPVAEAPKAIEPAPRTPTQAELDQAAIERMAGEGPTPVKTPAAETVAPKSVEPVAPAEVAPAAEKSWLGKRWEDLKSSFGYGEKPPAPLTQAERDARAIAQMETEGPVQLKPGAENPSGKVWNDPMLTQDEFVADYKAAYPKTGLTDKQLAAKFDAGQRLNPSTGSLKQEFITKTPDIPAAPAPEVIAPKAVEPAAEKTWRQSTKEFFGLGEKSPVAETPKAAIVPETVPAPKADAPAPRVEPTPVEITPTPKPVEPAPIVSAEKKTWGDSIRDFFGVGKKEPAQTPLTQAERDALVAGDQGPVIERPVSAPRQAEPPAPVEPAVAGRPDVTIRDTIAVAGDEGLVPVRPGAANPSGKAWNDRTLTRDEFVADYKAVYPKTTLTDAQLAERYNTGQRLNPETGRLKVPDAPVANAAERPSLLKGVGDWAVENPKKAIAGGVVVGGLAATPFIHFGLKDGSGGPPADDKTVVAPPAVPDKDEKDEVPPPPVVRTGKACGPNDTYASSGCFPPYQPSTTRGPGDGNNPTGQILDKDYYCITSITPVIVNPVPAGTPFPNNCYNKPGGGSTASSLGNSLGQLLGKMFGTSSPAPTPTPSATTKLPVTPPATTPTVAKPFATLIADPISILSGKKSKLIWSSVNTSSCELFAPDNLSMATGTRGSTSTLALATTTQFTLNCSATSGATTSAQTTVTVR